MWTTYTLDVETGELFVPVGNPAPDYAPDFRPGDNLFTDSVVVLDARTGKLKWFHQFTANDGLDYDFGAAPALYANRKGAKLLAAGSKDGNLYGIDRATRRVLFKTPVTTIDNAGAKPTKEGVLVCPGSDGGVEWNGPAVDPSTRAIYVGAVDWCQTYRTDTPVYKPGQLYQGTGHSAWQNRAGSEPRGWIYAVDGETGKTLWKYHAEAPIVAGVTPTAGGVVFSGDLNGNFLALDARTGAELYKLNTGGAVAGGVVTYEAGGKQYIALTSGNVSRATFSGSTGSPKIVIMTIGLDRDEPQIVAVKEEAPGAISGEDHGKALYTQYCSACHGATGEGGVGPSLKGEAAKKSQQEVAAFIKNPNPPMPKLSPAPLADQDVEDVATYVESLK